jgi:hypothetical protein
MKKLLIPIAIITVITGATLTGCKEPKEITMDQVQAIEDSIPKLFPSARTIHTLQDNDYSNVKLIVADPVFYNATPEQKQAMAIRTGSMILHVLGGDNSITKATLIITKDTHTENQDPADGIKTDMKIDSLEKAVKGK